MKTFALLSALAVTIAATSGAGGDAGPAAPAATVAASADSDTSIGTHLIQPEQLAAALTYPSSRRPALLQVGFNVLYRTGHITGSRYAGPGSKPEGLAALAKALKPLRKDQWVVLYCGCCPWEHCPNVHPAFREARSLGYRNVSVLFIRKNLQEDWIDKGFPMREGDQ